MIGVDPSASEITFPGYATNVSPSHKDLEGQTAEGDLLGLSIDKYFSSLTSFGSDPASTYSPLAQQPSVQHVPQPTADGALQAQFVPTLPHNGQAKLRLHWPRGASSSASSVVSASTDPSPMPSPAPSEKANPIPRHKRPSHQRAEVKRRMTIKDRLAELGTTIGTPESKKVSEIEILTKAAGITRNLMGQKSEMNQEMEQLRSQKQALIAELAELHKGLPPMGFVKETNPVTMDELYATAKKQKESVKFTVLQRCMDCLFGKFKEATAEARNVTELETAALGWASETSMTELRKAATVGCMDMLKVQPTILDERVVLTSTLPSTQPQAGPPCISAPADSTTSPTADPEEAPACLERMLDAALAPQPTEAVAFTLEAPPPIPCPSAEAVKVEEEALFLDCPITLPGDFDVSMAFNFDTLFDSPYSFSPLPEHPMEDSTS